MRPPDLSTIYRETYRGICFSISEDPSTHFESLVPESSSRNWLPYFTKEEQDIIYGDSEELYLVSEIIEVIRTGIDRAHAGTVVTE